MHAQFLLCSRWCIYLSQLLCTIAWIDSMIMLQLFLPFYRIKFDDSCSSTPSSSRIEYYCDDRDLPIYFKRTSGYPFDQLVKILMPSVVDETTVCSVRPVGVSANATFVVNIEKVHFNDLKCDDLGTWTATGTKSTFFRFTTSGIKISEKKPAQNGVPCLDTAILCPWNIPPLPPDQCRYSR